MPSQTSRQAIEQPRETWTRCLNAVSPERVIACANELRKPYRAEPLMLRAQGLALLRMREGCFGEDYHLGEIPLAEAALELVDHKGRRFAGGARVMSNSSEYAEAVAVIDAMVTHRLTGWRKGAELINEGMQVVESTDARRAEVRERTRVDFALLSTAGGDDDDA